MKPIKKEEKTKNINQIVSMHEINMEKIEKFDDYLRRIINSKTSFTKEYFGVTEPRKMEDYISRIKDLGDELKNIKDSWDNEYYVLEANIEFNHSTRKHKVLSMKLSLIKYTGEFDLTVDDNKKYRTKLKFSNEDIDNCYYTKYGVYNDKPLYIHENIEKLLGNGFELKEIHYEEIRSAHRQQFEMHGKQYTKVIENIWFYDGIILTDGEISVTDAKTGVYNADWNGMIISTYKDTNINGEVIFTTTKNKKEKLSIYSL